MWLSARGFPGAGDDRVVGLVHHTRVGKTAVGVSKSIQGLVYELEGSRDPAGAQAWPGSQ